MVNNGDHLIIYINVKPLYCTLETNIALYVNYMSIYMSIIKMGTGHWGSIHWKWARESGKDQMVFFLTGSCGRPFLFAVCTSWSWVPAMLPAAKVLRTPHPAFWTLQLRVLSWAGDRDKEKMTVKPGAVGVATIFFCPKSLNHSLPNLNSLWCWHLHCLSPI